MKLTAVAELGDGCIRLMRPLAESRKVVLKLEELAELPALRANQRGIKQVLLNLLSNAVKFTPEGGEVSLRAALEKEGTLIITVTDTGVGMDADDISEALTPFSQTDSGVANEEKGTGLGLPLANGLVEGHGGTLEIESKPGKGTTVTVRFPADRVILNPAAEKGEQGDTAEERQLQ